MVLGFSENVNIYTYMYSRRALLYRLSNIKCSFFILIFLGSDCTPRPPPHRATLFSTKKYKYKNLYKTLMNGVLKKVSWIKYQLHTTFIPQNLGLFNGMQLIKYRKKLWFKFFIFFEYPVELIIEDWPAERIFKPTPTKTIFQYTWSALYRSKIYRKFSRLGPRWSTGVYNN